MNLKTNVHGFPPAWESRGAEPVATFQGSIFAAMTIWM